MTTLLGGFALLIISQIQGRPLDQGSLTLITTLMAADSGWYFGTRSTVAGARAASDVASSTASQTSQSEVEAEHHTTV
jgi:hypothetical protein